MLLKLLQAACWHGGQNPAVEVLLALTLLSEKGPGGYAEGHWGPAASRTLTWL